MTLAIKKIRSKSILTKSKLPGCDYVINPYIGCTFACRYCYADFIKRFTGHGKEKWGQYVDIKKNAPDVLKDQLERLETKFRKYGEKKKIKILFGSITDPYQGIEAKYQITRECLGILRRYQFPLDISILTKSSLVTRDIALFREISGITIGLTITSTDDDLARLLECKAPPAKKRIRALAELNQAGISTYVCISPLLPHFVQSKKSFKELLDEVSKTGNSEIWLEHLNLSGKKLKRIRTLIKTKFPEKLKYYEDFSSEDYKAKLNQNLLDILSDYNFKIGCGGVIDHRRKMIIGRDRLLFTAPGNGWSFEVV